MADPDNAPPQPPGKPDRATDVPEADPEAAQGLRARVERQRQRIEGLTGEDPLRGGVDD